ncbi:MAG: methyltransferase domain-containing protein [Actinobacteria bacterium]|nr:methyltransferase domain-containing protein [Actinomycetota bacterium]
MIGDVVELLACPHCRGELELRDGVVTCAEGHAYDVARHGYVNLLPGGGGSGTADTAAMVAARSEALATTGPLAPLVRHVADHAAAVTPPVDGCVLDLGAGTGAHLARVLDALPNRRGLALDLSKHAARRAARAHVRLGAVVCDAWARLPVRDGVAALALSVFAPRNAAELARVLAPQGELLVVTPTHRHLSRLVAALGLVRVDARKDERLAHALAGHFVRIDDHTHGYDVPMDDDDIAAVVTMGPSAHHLGREALARRIAALDGPQTVSVDVRLSRYRSRA